MNQGVRTRPKSSRRARAKQPPARGRSIEYKPTKSNSIMKIHDTSYSREEEHEDELVTTKGFRRHFATHDYHDYGKVTESQMNLIKPCLLDGSRKPSRGGVHNPFPTVLHRMMTEADSHNFSHLVSWQPHGRAFLIHDPKRFVTSILPRYFKHSKLSSFQRQLSLYGFVRLTQDGHDKGAYYHELFLRGKPFLCRRINRTRVKGTWVRTSSAPDLEPKFFTMDPVLDGGILANRLSGNVLPMQPVSSHADDETRSSTMRRESCGGPSIVSDVDDEKSHSSSVVDERRSPSTATSPPFPCFRKPIDPTETTRATMATRSTLNDVLSNQWMELVGLPRSPPSESVESETPSMAESEAIVTDEVFAFGRQSTPSPYTRSTEGTIQSSSMVVSSEEAMATGSETRCSDETLPDSTARLPVSLPSSSNLTESELASFLNDVDLLEATSDPQDLLPISYFSVWDGGAGIPSQVCGV